MLDILKGGWVMVPLILCSIVALTITVERIIYFSRIGGKTEIAENVLELVKRGNLKGGLEIARNLEVPVTKVLSSGIEHYEEPGKAMEAAGIAECSVMRRGLLALDTIVTMSPLLGLLGTILGMINSFQVMAVAGGGSPHAVTGGVAEALIATATGISIAVLTLVPYNYFNSRAEHESEIIEQYATKLEMALIKQS